MKLRSLTVTLLLAGLTLCSGALIEPLTAQAGTPVPAEYAQLYSTLQSALNNYTSYLSTIKTSTVYPVVFGTELLPANANRGTALLAQGTMQGVTLYLDRLRELGVGGVTVAIGYPMYTRSFPRYQEYVQFYKQVAQEVRSHGMKLDVESSVLFANSPFSSITFSYAGITWAQFKAERKQMIQAIIQDLQPDYLNMGAEPDTEYKLSGFSEFNSPTDYAAYVNYILAGLDRGSTLMGAGVGTWGNLQYIQEYTTSTNLDFIDMHVYPIVGQASLQRVLTIAETVKQHGKRVVLDEAWLYKVATLQTTSIAANTDIFRLDAFSFWAPLDQGFLAAIIKSAQIEGIEYVSPFWSTLFFAYVDYNEATAVMPYNQLVQTVNKMAVSNMMNDQFSSTGAFYGQLAGIPTSQLLPTASHATNSEISSTTAPVGNIPTFPLELIIAALALGFATMYVYRRRNVKTPKTVRKKEK